MLLSCYFVLYTPKNRFVFPGHLYIPPSAQFSCRFPNVHRPCEIRKKCLEHWVVPTSIPKLKPYKTLLSFQSRGQQLLRLLRPGEGARALPGKMRHSLPQWALEAQQKGSSSEGKWMFEGFLGLFWDSCFDFRFAQTTACVAFCVKSEAGATGDLESHFRGPSSGSFTAQLPLLLSPRLA